MSATVSADPRSTEMKREMAEHFAEFEEDYREADWATIVYEDSEVIIVEDTKGYEIDEWCDEFDDVEVSQIMHDAADDLVDRSWTSTHPVVFDKLANAGGV